MIHAMAKTSIGIIGLGYWGPNLVRNFAAQEQAEVACICDVKEEHCRKFALQYPSIRTTTNPENLWSDPTLDAIVIATPTASHHSLAKSALESGKHVLLEKPITASSTEARDLIHIAKKRELILMVDHTFVYEDAVQTVKHYIDTGTLGEMLYFDSIRINLGLIRQDTNVLWDLAVHDLSILTYLLPREEVTDIHAYGLSHYTKNIEDAHLHMTLSNGTAAHIHVSWLSPVKIRQTLIGGTEKMVLYNDNEPSEKIRLYNKGVDIKREEQSFALPVYRSGDVLIPHLKTIEPLKELARHFCACIRGEEKPKTPGEDGLKVIEILEKADQSLTPSP